MIKMISDDIALITWQMFAFQFSFYFTYSTCVTLANGSNQDNSLTFPLQDFGKLCLMGNFYIEF